MKLVCTYCKSRNTEFIINVLLRKPETWQCIDCGKISIRNPAQVVIT